MIARCFQKEDNYAEAVRFYELAIGDTRVPLPAPAQVHYDRGLCYQQLKQFKEAAAAWQECLKQVQGPEGRAAALALAELRLIEHALEQIPEMLSLAVAQVEPATGWKNPLVDLARATDLFERSIRTLRDASMSELAARALTCYARFAVPRRLLVLQAETKAEWARALTKASNGNPTDVQTEQINKLFTEAAEAYATLAAMPGVQPIDRGRLPVVLRTECDRVEERRPRPCLPRRVRETEPRTRSSGRSLVPARRGVPQGQQVENAGKAYRKCQEFNDSKAICRACFQLAMIALEANEPEEAEAALVLNLKMLRWDSEPVALPQTLFALGNLLYQRQQYARLVRYLENALGQFKDNPDVYPPAISSPIAIASWPTRPFRVWW